MNRLQALSQLHSLGDFHQDTLGDNVLPYCTQSIAFCAYTGLDRQRKGAFRYEPLRLLQVDLDLEHEGQLTEIGSWSASDCVAWYSCVLRQG